MRASPPVGFPPLRVVVTAEVKGGANDFQDFYCASVEWDWGDGTKSQSQIDCDPYEPGKSEIKRRYVEEHTFRGTGMTSTRRRSNRQPAAGAAVPRPVRPEAEGQDSRIGLDDSRSALRDVTRRRRDQ